MVFFFTLSLKKQFYNERDVEPFMRAVQCSFDNFARHFNINALRHLSLPALALQALFANFSQRAAPVYAFHRGATRLRNLFREQIIGGLVNVFARHIHLDGAECYPREARFAPNGSPFTHHVFFDFK